MTTTDTISSSVQYYSYSSTLYGITSCTVIPTSSITADTDTYGVESISLDDQEGTLTNYANVLTARSVLSGTPVGETFSVTGCTIYGITDANAPTVFDDSASLTEDLLFTDPNPTTIVDAAASDTSDSSSCSTAASTYLNNLISMEGWTNYGPLTITANS